MHWFIALVYINHGGGLLHPLPPTPSSTFGISPNAISSQSSHSLLFLPQPPIPQALVCDVPLPVVLVFLIVQHPLMSENMWCLVCCSGVSLLRMMVSRFIRVPAKNMNSFFFMVAQYSMVYICHIFFIQSVIDGPLGWFQVFAIVNRNAVKIPVCACVLIME